MNLLACIACISLLWVSKSEAQTLAYAGNNMSLSEEFNFINNPVSKNSFYPHYGSRSVADELSVLMVVGAPVVVVVGVLMAANQHDQSSTGFADGEACVFIGGIAVFIGGWCYLVTRLSTHSHRYALASYRNQLGLAYNFK